MRKLLPVLLISILFCQKSIFAQAKIDPFNQVQIKGTHNSYSSEWVDSPATQIDNYNIWDIELDFGVEPSSSAFIVGHNCPEPNGNLCYLRDWVASIKSTNSAKRHPLILKLEAKTKDTSSPLGDWCWAPSNQWGNWQYRLQEELITIIGEKNWITRDTFEKGFHSTWPSVKELAGKFIITLQDNNGNHDIPDTSGPYFFISKIPGISCSDFITDESEFNTALKANTNRLILDYDAGYFILYSVPFANVLVHVPLPTVVNPSLQTDYQYGTPINPFQTVGHAINTNWTQHGKPSIEELRIQAGNYPEKVTISIPCSLYAAGGTVTIGGISVAYTVILRLADVDEAGTSDPVYVRFNGSAGSTPEFSFDANGLPRNICQARWYTSSDIGTPNSITVRVDGDDDVDIDAIIVCSATAGWYFSDFNAWVGNDNINPRTFSLSH